MKLSHTLALVGTLLAAGTSASFAADTLGERLANGQISQGAFTQLIATTGINPEEAKSMTLDEVVEIRWQDN